MQPDGGEAPPQENAKRTRRPSVRLHQPYYENPGHRKLQQQWRQKKGATAAPPRKPRTAKNAHLKDAENDVVGKGGEAGNFDLDEDVAIGNWGNFSAANRDRDFKRKRVRSSNSRNARSRRNGGHGIGDSPLSNCGEIGEKELGQEQEEFEFEEEEDLGVNGGIDSNLVVEDSNPSSPNHSFHDDDDDDNRNSHKLSSDNNNVGGNQSQKQKKFMDNRHSIDNNNGVKMWLNDLGFRKYTLLFEIHGVDDQVLPLLTLEDLKDMGINEVGVRRKMYSSIQKLEKSFP